MNIVWEGLLQALHMMLGLQMCWINLKWKTLETRRFHTKATFMYKIPNDLPAPQLSNSFVNLIVTNINLLQS